MFAIEPSDGGSGWNAPAWRRPWRSGLLLVALGVLIAAGGLALSAAIGRWMGAEGAAPGIIGRAAGYPLGLIGFAVALEGVHRMLWWGPSRVPRWWRFALSVLATCGVGWVVSTVAMLAAYVAGG